VSSVSQQGQAAGENTTQHLDNHEAADQDQGDDQAAPAGLAQFSSVIVGMAGVGVVFVLCVSPFGLSHSRQSVMDVRGGNSLSG
jgi:acetylglutamate synthase